MAAPVSDASKCEFFNCGDIEHVDCGVCGGPVCLGGMSDYQRERVVWRAKAERKPITHFGCAQTERRAA